MNPAQHFQHYFDIAKADHEDLQEQAFNIRYKVYCREFEYESEESCSGQRETDEYDTHSQQSLLIHKPSNRAIGCVRLVEANLNKPELPLPFERYCTRALDKNRFDPDEFLPGQVAEFSRLAVVSDFRRRASDRGHEVNLPQPILTQQRQRSRFPVVPVSLFLAALAMLLNSDAEYGVAMIEPRLMRLLRLFGINFELVGRAMDYHGTRAPYIIHRDNALLYLDAGVGELFLEIDKSLHQHNPQSRYSVA